MGLFAPFAIGGALLGAAQGFLDNNSARGAATQAFNREKWFMQNRYQLQVEDMRKAGLNPALAYSQQAPMPGVQMGNMSKGAAVAGMHAGAQASVSAAQVRALNAEANLKDAMAVTEHNRPENVSADTDLKVTQRALASMNYNAVEQSIQKMRAETANLYASAAAHEAAVRVADATIPKLFAEVRELGTRSAVQAMDEVLKGLDASKQKALLPFLVQMGIAESYTKQLSLPEAEALAAKWRTQFGQSSLPWVHEALKAIGSFPAIIKR